MDRNFKFSFKEIYATTAEDKLDDINFVIGIYNHIEETHKLKLYQQLLDFFENQSDKIKNLLDAEYDLVKFPELFLINIRIKDILIKPRFDKQGKSFGLALLQKLLRADNG